MATNNQAVTEDDFWIAGYFATRAWNEHCRLNNRVAVLESDARVHEALLRDERTALEDALDGIDFARTEGFEWPTDPYTPAILKACPPIKLPKKEEGS